MLFGDVPTTVGSAIGFVLSFVIVLGCAWFVVSKWRKAYRAAVSLRASMEAQLAAASEAHAAAQSTATGGNVALVLGDSFGRSDTDSALSGVGSSVPGLDAHRRAVGQVMAALPSELADSLTEEDVMELLIEASPAMGARRPGAAQASAPLPVEATAAEALP